MISWKGEAFFRSTLLAYQFDMIEFHAFMDNNVLSAFILYFVTAKNIRNYIIFFAFTLMLLQESNCFRKQSIAGKTEENTDSPAN